MNLTWLYFASTVSWHRYSANTFNSPVKFQDQQRWRSIHKSVKLTVKLTLIIITVYSTDHADTGKPQTKNTFYNRAGESKANRNDYDYRHYLPKVVKVSANTSNLILRSSKRVTSITATRMRADHEQQTNTRQSLGAYRRPCDLQQHRTRDALFTVRRLTPVSLRHTLVPVGSHSRNRKTGKLRVAVADYDSESNRYIVGYNRDDSLVIIMTATIYGCEAPAV